MTVKDCIDEIKQINFLIDAIDSYLAGWSEISKEDIEKIRYKLIDCIDEIKKRVVDY